MGKKRSCRLCSMAGMAVFLLAWPALQSPVKAQDASAQGLGHRVAGAYLLEGQILEGGPNPGARFHRVMVMTSEGTLMGDVALAVPRPEDWDPSSASFGVWKRISSEATGARGGDNLEGLEEGNRRVRMRFLSFNRLKPPFPEILFTDRSTITAEFDSGFQTFEGTFVVEVFCSNEALCHPVQDALVDSVPLFVLTGTISGRRISLDD